MPTVNEIEYDVAITANSVTYGFMIVPNTLRRERVDDFAPRISTGNEPSLREGIWDVWAMRGAAEGIDQLTFTNRNKIYRSDGNVFLGREELFTLDAAWNSSDASKNATAPQFVDFNTGGTDYVVAAIGTKIRRYNIGAATWTDSTTTLGASCVWLHRHGTRIFAACGASQDFYSSTDLATWATPSVGEKATCFTTWQKKSAEVYLVKASGTSIKLSTDDGVTFGSAIAVGNPDTNITGLGVAFGLLIIGKEDAIYYYDGTNIVEQTTFQAQKYGGNCKALVYHEGFLYTHVLGRIWKLSFSTSGISNLVDVTPDMIGDENKELYGHGIPIWMWTGSRYLYVAFDGGETVYPEVLRYDGLGWHQFYRGASSDTMRAGGYSRLAARSFINDGASRLRRHPNLRDFPYPDYASTGVFETSDFDGGLPNWYKAFRDVQVECENISGTGIQVEYSVDKGATFTSLGYCLFNGINSLTFPNSTPVAAQKLRLRFTINRNSSSSSPRIRQFWVAFLNRPLPTYGLSVTLRLAPNQLARKGTRREPVSITERLGFLYNAEASQSPVEFEDMNAKIDNVYITKTSYVKLWERPFQNTTPPDELQVTVTMIQVFTPARWDEAVWDSAIYS